MQPLTTAKRLPRWDHTIIGFVGRLVPWKRPDIFIRAAGLLTERAKGDERIPGLVFVVTGEDEEGMTPDLEELAERCGIADRCYPDFRNSAVDSANLTIFGLGKCRISGLWVSGTACSADLPP